MPMSTCESQLICWFVDVVAPMTTLMRDALGTTRGRDVSVCGNIGTTTIASRLGCMIGPPADSAYAVEPVGEATIRPSERWS